MTHLWSLTLLLCTSLVWAVPQIIPSPTAVLPSGAPTIPSSLQLPSQTITKPAAEGAPSAQAAPSALPKSYLTALPLSISLGGNAPVVYTGNSSLLQANPGIQSEVNKNLSLIGHVPTNLTARDIERRDECLEGINPPYTWWSNFALLTPYICDAWFPGGTFWMPSGSSGTITATLGGGNPKIKFLYQTIKLPCSACAAPMTSAICQSTILGLLQYSQLQSAINCAIWPLVNEVDNFDDTSAGINFEIEAVN